MSTPSLLNALAWLLALSGCGLKFFSDRLREPPPVNWNELAWSKHKEATRAEFIHRRFAVWKRVRSDLGTILTLAGVALSAALQFLSYSPVVIATRVVGVLLAAWALWSVLLAVRSLRDLHNRELWEQVYEFGRPFKYLSNDSRECFLAALKAFEQKHPREHRRLGYKLLAEYDASQRAHEQELADHAQGLKRILA